FVLCCVRASCSAIVLLLYVAPRATRAGAVVESNRSESVATPDVVPDMNMARRDVEEGAPGGELDRLHGREVHRRLAWSGATEELLRDLPRPEARPRAGSTSPPTNSWVKSG